MLRYVLLAVLGLPILALALVGFRYLTRGTPVRAVRTLGTRGGDVPAAREPRLAARRAPDRGADQWRQDVPLPVR
jgi:hypothetical protein